jgi:hypothetical protein
MLHSYTQTDKDVAISSWCDVFENIDHVRVERAVKEYIQSGAEYPPSASKIYTIAKDIKIPMQINAEQISQGQCPYCDGSGVNILIDKNDYKAFYMCPCSFNKELDIAVRQGNLERYDGLARKQQEARENAERMGFTKPSQKYPANADVREKLMDVDVFAVARLLGTDYKTFVLCLRNELKESSRQHVLDAIQKVKSEQFEKTNRYTDLGKGARVI